MRAGLTTRLSIIIVNPRLDSRARTALKHMLESVVSARGKVLRTNFSATSRVTRATKLPLATRIDGAVHRLAAVRRLSP